MQIAREFTEEVKNQADIVRVVSDYVTLKKRGANYVARCPFHSEKTPSFNVHPGKGIYKCFGCGAGGGIFDFIMQIEGCSFHESVRIVAEKSGIPIPRFTETEDHQKAAQHREAILRLNEWTAEFFENCLADEKEGGRAREYLVSRGITTETRQLFRIGYAPDRWDALIGYLKQKGATLEEMGLSGLVIFKEEGGCYDRFRGRLMFPITDSQNRVIAFGGRVIGEGEPKYLNSPETAVYTKGRNLYGLALAKNEIRKLGYAILVEGYLDCVIPHQEGIGNVVATLGTALTESQVRLLRRYAEQPRVVVNFDPDSAGQAATLRSIEILLSEGFKINVLRLPTDQDPDEFIRTRGAAAFRELLKSTQPYIEYVIERAMSEHSISRPSGKVEAINAVLPHLVRMRDKVERADYAAQLADRFKVDSRIIREEIKRAATVRQTALDSKRVRMAEDITPGERQLLELILLRSDVRNAILSSLSIDDTSDLATTGIFNAIAGLETTDSDLDYEGLGRKLESDEERALLTTLMMSDLGWAGADDFDTLFKKATEAVTSLRLRRLEKQLDLIHRELGQAEREHDEERWQRLFQEKAEVKRRILRLSA